MLTPLSSILTLTAPLGAGAQNDFVYSILPIFAVAMGVLCFGSYITTRVIKKLL